MSTKRKNPARKATKTAAKQRGSTKEAAAKDAAAPTTAKAPRTPKAPRERDPRLPAVGETITKEWRGKTLKVRCAEDGFVLDGTTYRTLSAAAKAASGFASVNGYLFFQLIPSRKPATGGAAPKGTGRKSAKASVPVDGIDLSTPAGQRAALAAAGITTKRGKKGEKAVHEMPAPESTETK